MLGQSARPLFPGRAGRPDKGEWPVGVSLRAGTDYEGGARAGAECRHTERRGGSRRPGGALAAELRERTVGRPAMAGVPWTPPSREQRSPTEPATALSRTTGLGAATSSAGALRSEVSSAGPWTRCSEVPAASHPLPSTIEKSQTPRSEPRVIIGADRSTRSSSKAVAGRLRGICPSENDILRRHDGQYVPGLFRAEALRRNSRRSAAGKDRAWCPQGGVPATRPSPGREWRSPSMAGELECAREPVPSTEEENADGQAGAMGTEVPYRFNDGRSPIGWQIDPKRLFCQHVAVCEDQLNGR